MPIQSHTSEQVRLIVAEALAQEPASVQMGAFLVDDLGA